MIKERTKILTICQIKNNIHMNPNLSSQLFSFLIKATSRTKKLAINRSKISKTICILNIVLSFINYLKQTHFRSKLLTIFHWRISLERLYFQGQCTDARKKMRRHSRLSHHNFSQRTNLPSPPSFPALSSHWLSALTLKQIWLTESFRNVSTKTNQRR